MGDAERKALNAELQRSRSELVRSEFGEIPRSISLLVERFHSSGDAEVRTYLYQTLLGECVRSRNDTVLLHYCRQGLTHFPDDPIFAIGAAFNIAIIEPSAREEVRAIAERAVTLALSQDRLIRRIATEMARIGILLRDTTLLNKALSVLVADAGHLRKEDSAYVFDFVEHIDPEKCDPNLLLRYRALERTRPAARSESSDGSAE